LLPRARAARVRAMPVSDAAGVFPSLNPPAHTLIGLPAGKPAPEELDKVEDKRTVEVELPSGRVVEACMVRIEWQDAPARLLTLRDVTERLRTQASLVVLTEELRSAN